jgi:hypothetical protein
MIPAAGAIKATRHEITGFGVSNWPRGGFRRVPDIRKAAAAQVDVTAILGDLGRVRSWEVKCPG